jgi:hypothetical protein
VNISLKRSRFFGGESREREERRVEEGEKEKERRRKGEKKGERVGVEEETKREHFKHSRRKTNAEWWNIFFYAQEQKKNVRRIHRLK